jgi:hypothetical protein
MTNTETPCRICLGSGCSACQGSGQLRWTCQNCFKQWTSRAKADACCAQVPGLPTTMTRDQLLEVCRVLGLDPDRTASITLDPAGAWLEVRDGDSYGTVNHYMQVVADQPRPKSAHELTPFDNPLGLCLACSGTGNVGQGHGNCARCGGRGRK